MVVCSELRVPRTFTLLQCCILCVVLLFAARRATCLFIAFFTDVNLLYFRGVEVSFALLRLHPGLPVMSSFAGAASSDGATAIQIDRHASSTVIYDSDSEVRPLWLHEGGVARPGRY